MSTVAIICGGRELDWQPAYAEWLRAYHLAENLIWALVGSNIQRGGKPVGADAYAYAWAGRCGIDRLCLEANWVKYGKPAGPIRNGQLLDLQHYLAQQYRSYRVVLALPGGPGTQNMGIQAEAAGVPVVRYEVHTVAEQESGQEQLFGQSSKGMHA
jgi:hypothetical protein